MYATSWSSGAALFLIVVLLFALRKKLTVFLRDKSMLPPDKRSFSLASTLIFYWTVIIVVSVCYIGIVDDNIVTIDNGVLILMGIVVGTTTAGKAIDANQSVDPTIARSQDFDASQGFFTDILSDGNGISVSRFQTVVFNLIYGCTFISMVVSQHVLYNFPTQTLTLLGISSGAYALLKIPENTGNTVSPVNVPIVLPVTPVAPVIAVVATDAAADPAAAPAAGA